MPSSTQLPTSASISRRSTASATPRDRARPPAWCLSATKVPLCVMKIVVLVPVMPSPTLTLRPSPAFQNQVRNRAPMVMDAPDSSRPPQTDALKRHLLAATTSVAPRSTSAHAARTTRSLPGLRKPLHRRPHPTTVAEVLAPELATTGNGLPHEYSPDDFMCRDCVFARTGA